MANRCIRFFALKDDLQSPVAELEKEFSVKYWRTGMFDSPDIPIFNSAFDIPNIGESKGDWIIDDGFLIAPHRKKFRKIDEFYVGIHAEKNLKMNWRLVLDHERSKEYDLTYK